jgi:hypothetical protein
MKYNQNSYVLDKLDGDRQRPEGVLVWSALLLVFELNWNWNNSISAL